MWSWAGLDLVRLDLVRFNTLRFWHKSEMSRSYRVYVTRYMGQSVFSPSSTSRKSVCMHDPTVSCIDNQINGRLAPSRSSSSVPVFCYWLTWHVFWEQDPDGGMTRLNRNGHEDHHIHTHSNMCMCTHLCTSIPRISAPRFGERSPWPEFFHAGKCFWIPSICSL